MPAIGTAFQVKGTDFHFWIVISNPRKNKVLVVNLTDQEHNRDWTCRLGASDYCALTKPSIVFYRKAEEWSADKIDSELSSEERLKRLPDCPLDIVGRIIDGARVSEEFKPKLLAYL